MDEGFSNYLRVRSTPDFISDFILGGPRKDIYPTTFVNAAVWLVSRDCFCRVGLFDPIFPHYGEDDDYIDRVHGAGFRVGIVPGALANHARDNQAEGVDVKGMADFRSDVNREYVSLLLQFKRLGGSAPRKRLFFFRKMISSVFHDALMLDFPQMKKDLRSYGLLLKRSFSDGPV